MISFTFAINTTSSQIATELLLTLKSIIGVFSLSLETVLKNVPISWLENLSSLLSVNTTEKKYVQVILGNTNEV
jgi:hypothetical protein